MDQQVRLAKNHLDDVAPKQTYAYADCAKAYIEKLDPSDMGPGGKGDYQAVLRLASSWFNKAARNSSSKENAQTYYALEFDAHQKLLGFWLENGELDLKTSMDRAVIVSTLTEYGWAAERLKKGGAYFDKFVSVNDLSMESGATSLYAMDSSARRQLLRAVASCDSWDFNGVERKDEELSQSLCSNACREPVSDLVGKLKGAKKFGDSEYRNLYSRMERAFAGCTEGAAGL